MDAVFINKIKHTKNINIEMNKGYNTFLKLPFHITLALLYIALALFLYFYSYETIESIIAALLGIFFGFFPIIRLHTLANKQQKQFLLLYNETPESITYFYDDHIKTITPANNAEIKLDYDKIIKLKQTKNMYLLILNEKLIVMVDKNRFENGTCEEFEKFIVSKAVNAKNKL